ncbi:ABC transporter ATP-binding protein [uncultured Pseudodesulfovibrio sp.]|uniref:ABC transporter ATP-binding protein n=1 Tax=uncultured Pseudodesulfovibrio sp. TaxID=2035858 RepID=UPI0029C8EA60|nr:ABC transporter ATP-binding protein [uncultured Pseudodesulfovibrio sp.]
MTNPRTVIHINGVSKHFGTGDNLTYALKDITLSVDRGEVLMLMGPSGSGKTTLLSIMGCILQPSAGTLSIAGVEATGLNAKKLGALRLEHLGFIFQEYNLFPTLSVVDNILVALHLRGVKGSEARKRALAALDSVGLEAKADAMPETMSGGQKQRLAIARALAGRPSIILADEPTAALDSANGKMIVELMTGLAHEQNHCVVMVTHDPRTIDYADRMLTIEDGTLAATQNTPTSGGY